MEFSNCILFQKSEGYHVSQTGHCDLSGKQTFCGGDILYCEVLDTLRDYVLKKSERPFEGK